MTTIAQLPELVRLALELHADELWAWVNAQLAGQVETAAGADDLLVRIGKRFDWAGIERACQDFRRHVAGGRGQDARHTVGQLSRGLLVRYLYGWSYAQVVEQLGRDGMVRQFIGYRAGAHGFSVKTLWTFEQWVKEHHPRLLFSELLNQIDEDFPAERKAPQVGDTFALLSRAHPQTRTELLRGASQRLLAGLTAIAAAPLAERFAMSQPPFDPVALFGPAQEKPEAWLEKAGRDALEEATALAAQGLVGLVTPLLFSLPRQREPEWLACEHRLKVLGKILHDEFVCHFDEQGQCIQAKLRDKHVHGAFRLGSILDEEATFRNHGDKSQLGYNISVAATVNFVREIAAATGATPDSAGVAPLIAAQAEHLGRVPPKLIYDRAAGFPKVFAEVAQASHGQTQLVARLVDHSKRCTRFGPLDFSLAEDSILTCPNGQQTSRAYRSQSGDGWNYRFMPDQCAGCPLIAQCRGDAVKPNHYRQVFVSHYRYQQRQALAYIATDAFKLDMKLRPHVERMIAALVRYNGARHARGLGLKNADFQVRMAATAFNLKRWLALTLEQEQEAKRRAKPPPVDA
jgi:hypothetical protein